MYIVIRHINGEIDGEPFIINSLDIKKFINGEYLIFSTEFLYKRFVENCLVNVLKQIKD